MKAFFYRRIRGGWSPRIEREMTPAEVRAVREAHLSLYPRDTKDRHAVMFKRTKIGDEVFGGCAGTESEILESGGEP